MMPTKKFYTASTCIKLQQAPNKMSHLSAGYTPLHMAVGYSHVGAVKALLDAGASPEIADNQGRNVVQLVDSIRESMPYSPQLAGKRIALEEVAALLAGEYSAVALLLQDMRHM